MGRQIIGNKDLINEKMSKKKADYKDPAAHINVPEPTSEDLLWAETIRKKWRPNFPQELYKCLKDNNLWRIKMLLDWRVQNQISMDIDKSVGSWNEASRTLLQHAFQRSNILISEMLLCHGADIRKGKNDNPIERAIYKEDPLFIKLLFKYGVTTEEMLMHAPRSSEKRAVAKVVAQERPEDLKKYSLDSYLEKVELEEVKEEVKKTSSSPVLWTENGQDRNFWFRAGGSDHEITHCVRFEQTDTTIQQVFNFQARSVTTITQVGKQLAPPVIRNFKEVEGEHILFTAHEELQRQKGKPAPFYGRDIDVIKHKSLPDTKNQVKIKK